MNIKNLKTTFKEYFYKNNKLIVILIFVFFAVLYTCFCTKSSLWYDEAIEYWYSKTLSGTVPVGGTTTTMYERIVSTYQPPLYNWLMYLWLQIADTEFWFKFAGVITTIIGAIGFYQVTKEITNEYCSHKRKRF